MVELAAERHAATAAITQLHLTPVLFELGARPYPPRDLYRAYVLESDLFIGIYGQSYGWVAPDMDISGLEDEYRLSSDKPRLIYVKHVEQRDPKLAALLDTIRAEGRISYRGFQDADELRRLVADDLAQLLTDRFAGGEATPTSSQVAPLPVPRWPMVDRHDELQMVTSLLRQPDVGLVTLTGPGGVGKTTLALAAARAVADQFADGVAFIPLETLTDPALIRSTVVQQLHIPIHAGQTLDDALLAFFRPRNMLVVVDNVEQLATESPLVEQALEMAPGLRVLATSREALHVRGEHVVPVAPFEVPDQSKALDVTTLAQVPAVEFFIARVRQEQPDFNLNESNAADVVEICRRLDGLPLALQLAAARMGVLTPALLLARLKRRLPILIRGPRDLPGRQQTLRAAIAWSYDLLSPAEQALFRQLGVFAGGVSLEGVNAVFGGGESELDPLDGLSSLVDKSLVVVRALNEATPWYSMLETIREFALEKLDEAGEGEVARRRHAEFLSDIITQRVEPLLLVPSERDTWMARTERGQDNVRAALTWSLSAEGDLTTGVAIIGGLGWFWLLTGRATESLVWCEAVLKRRAAGDNSVAWAQVLHAAALALWQRGEIAQASAREEEAVAIFRTAGDSRWLSYGLALLARVRTFEARLEEARLLLEEARTVWHGVANTYGQIFGAYLLYYLGVTALLQGHEEEARVQLEESLAEVVAAHDDLGRGVMLGALGLLAARRGQHAEARSRFNEGLPLLRASSGDQWDLALLLLNAGLEAVQAGTPESGTLLVEALRVWSELGVVSGAGLALAGLGEVVAARGAPVLAGGLLGAAQTLLAPADALLRVVVPYDLTSSVATARAAGDRQAFDRGLAQGRGWTFDRAVEAGLGEGARLTGAA
jgi:predicted ATPase